MENTALRNNLRGTAMINGLIIAVASLAPALAGYHHAQTTAQALAVPAPAPAVVSHVARIAHR